MTLAWDQLAIVAVGAAILLWPGTAKVKELLGGLLPKSTPAVPVAPADPVLERVTLALKLRAACEQACPKAIEHIDQAFLHLLPGHVEVSK